jgi:hypothetical protein
VAIAMGVRRLIWIVNVLYIGIVGWTDYDYRHGIGREMNGAHLSVNEPWLADNTSSDCLVQGAPKEAPSLLR